MWIDCNEVDLEDALFAGLKILFNIAGVVNGELLKICISALEIEDFDCNQANVENHTSSSNLVEAAGFEPASANAPLWYYMLSSVLNLNALSSTCKSPDIEFLKFNSLYRNNKTNELVSYDHAKQAQAQYLLWLTRQLLRLC